MGERSGGRPSSLFPLEGETPHSCLIHASRCPAFSRVSEEPMRARREQNLSRHQKIFLQKRLSHKEVASSNAPKRETGWAFFLRALTPMAQQDKISILGPGTTAPTSLSSGPAAAERLAISVPSTNAAAVLKHFQATTAEPHIDPGWERHDWHSEARDKERPTDWLDGRPRNS